MALPADVNYVTVTGTFQFLSGEPMAGQTVTFTPSFADVVLDRAYARIIGKTVLTTTLDFEGHFSIYLPATDDPDLTPTGFTYKVTEPLGSGRVYHIALPSSTPGGTVDLADIVPSGMASPGTVQLVSGPTGPRGPSWFVTEGPPASTTGRIVGDLTLDQDSGLFYQLRSV